MFTILSCVLLAVYMRTVSYLEVAHNDILTAELWVHVVLVHAVGIGCAVTLMTIACAPHGVATVVQCPCCPRAGRSTVVLFMSRLYQLSFWVSVASCGTIIIASRKVCQDEVKPYTTREEKIFCDCMTTNEDQMALLSDFNRQLLENLCAPKSFDMCLAGPDFQAAFGNTADYFNHSFCQTECQCDTRSPFPVTAAVAVPPSLTVCMCLQASGHRVARGMYRVSVRNVWLCFRLRLERIHVSASTRAIRSGAEAPPPLLRLWLCTYLRRQISRPNVHNLWS